MLVADVVAAAWMDTLDTQHPALETVGRSSGMLGEEVLIELAGIR